MSLQPEGEASSAAIVWSPQALEAHNQEMALVQSVHATIVEAVLSQCVTAGASILEVGSGIDRWFPASLEGDIYSLS